jgi:glycosyltransferase involved in cell wall biosynthesis
MRPWDPHDARRPLRFAFHGTTRNNKGLLWLLRAIPLLDPDVRRRCQFVIRAAGWDWPFRKLASPYPEVQFTGGYDALQLLAAWGEYDVGILCHVWFDNLPLVMLEHLHGGKFVVSSRLGGPADWLDSRVTGLLYAAGHPEQLAQCITRLVRGDVTIASPREIHAAAPLPSFPAHVAQIEEIYLEALDRDGDPLAS